MNVDIQKYSLNVVPYFVLSKIQFDHVWDFQNRYSASLRLKGLQNYRRHYLDSYVCNRNFTSFIVRL